MGVLKSWESWELWQTGETISRQTEEPVRLPTKKCFRTVSTSSVKTDLVLDMVVHRDYWLHLLFRTDFDPLIHLIACFTVQDVLLDRDGEQQQQQHVTTTTTAKKGKSVVECDCYHMV